MTQGTMIEGWISGVAAHPGHGAKQGGALLGTAEAAESAGPQGTPDSRAATGVGAAQLRMSWEEELARQTSRLGEVTEPAPASSGSSFASPPDALGELPLAQVSFAELNHAARPAVAVQEGANLVPAEPSAPGGAREEGTGGAARDAREVSSFGRTQWNANFLARTEIRLQNRLSGLPSLSSLSSSSGGKVAEPAPHAHRKADVVTPGKHMIEGIAAAAPDPGGPSGIGLAGPPPVAEIPVHATAGNAAQPGAARPILPSAATAASSPPPEPPPAAYGQSSRPLPGAQLVGMPSWAEPRVAAAEPGFYSNGWGGANEKNWAGNTGPNAISLRPFASETNLGEVGAALPDEAPARLSSARYSVAADTAHVAAGPATASYPTPVEAARQAPVAESAPSATESGPTFGPRLQVQIRNLLRRALGEAGSDRDFDGQTGGATAPLGNTAAGAKLLRADGGGTMVDSAVAILRGSAVENPAGDAGGRSGPEEGRPRRIAEAGIGRTPSAAAFADSSQLRVRTSLDRSQPLSAGLAGIPQPGAPPEKGTGTPEAQAMVNSPEEPSFAEEPVRASLGDSTPALGAKGVPAADSGRTREPRLPAGSQAPLWEHGSVAPAPVSGRSLPSTPNGSAEAGPVSQTDALASAMESASGSAPVRPVPSAGQGGGRRVTRPGAAGSGLSGPSPLLPGVAVPLQAASPDGVSALGTGRTGVSEGFHEGGGDPYRAMDAGVPMEALRPASGTRSELEVGYQDPVLGYVELRAHTEGAGVHATLGTQSAAAGETLEGHLSSLAGWMNFRHTPVESLTVLALDPSGASPAETRTAHPGSGFGDGGRLQGDGNGNQSGGGRESPPEERGPAAAPAGFSAPDSGRMLDLARFSESPLAPPIPHGSSISVVA